MKWKLVDMDVTWWRMWKMSCGSCVLRSSLWSYWSSSLRRVARRCESYDESWVSGAAGRYSSAMKSRILVFIVMMRMSVESSFLLFYIYNSSTGRERKMIWPMRRIIASSFLSLDPSAVWLHVSDDDGCICLNWRISISSSYDVSSFFGTRSSASFLNLLDS